MRTDHPLRSWVTVLSVLAALPLFAQGTENAIAAAVLFGAVVIGAVLAGLVIAVLYLFKRRRWQRVVVLVFGALLLIGGSALGAQQGAPADIEFLSLLLSGAGVVFLVLGMLLRARPFSRAEPGS